MSTKAQTLVVLFTPFYLDLSSFPEVLEKGDTPPLQLSAGGPRILALWTEKGMITPEEVQGAYGEFQKQVPPTSSNPENSQNLGDMGQFEKFVEFFLKNHGLEKAHLFSVADFLTHHDQLNHLQDLPRLIESYGTLLQNLDQKEGKANFFKQLFGND